MSVKIGICDDQSEFIEKIERHINAYTEEHGTSFEVSAFTSPDALLSSDWMQFNIIFLDVVMGEEKGIDVAKKIRDGGSEAVIIFISGYIDYAVMGYDVKACAYLLKADLEKTFSGAMTAALRDLSKANPSIDFHVSKGVVVIPVKQIRSIECLKRMVQLNGDENLRFYESMANLENKLREHGFLRIHKSFIISMDHCTGLKNYTAYLDDGSKLPCSRKEFRSLMQEFLKYKGRF